MACSTSTNNVVLMHLGLLFFSLAQCTNSEKWNIHKYSVSTSGNPRWQYGTLVIGDKTEKGRSKKSTHINYQSDMVWNAPEHELVQEYDFPGYDNTPLERLLKVNPKVYCFGDHMMLQVEDADCKPGALLFVDRGDLLPLSPSKLPRNCGFTVSSMRRDFVMTAPYDGCFVVPQESCHVLPLRWFGLPVQMSCPITPPSTAMPKLICLPSEMLITTDWMSMLSEIKVNLRGQWVPLKQVLGECSVRRVGRFEDSEETWSFPFKPPCVDKEDGKYIMKLSGAVDADLSCPSQTTASYLQLMMNEQISVPGPTQSVQTTAPHLHFDAPQSPPSDQSPLHSQDGHKVVEQQSFPMYTGSMSPGAGFGYYPYPMFQPNMQSVPAFDHKPEQPSQRENPQVGMSSNYDPTWFWNDPHLFPPFNLPHQPVWPEAPPQPTASIKPEVSPTYSCPIHHPTEEPKITARPPATVPENYPLFGLYHYPHSLPHLPHSITAPTPSTLKPQDLPIAHPGTVVVFPKHSQSDVTQSLACFHQCEFGLHECCTHFSFHQHFNFLPHNQNGVLHVPHIPLPGQHTDLRPDLLQASSQDTQEVPGPPSRSTFTNALFSPESYLFGGLPEGPIYHPPQEGSPVALPGGQTDSPTAHEYYPYGFGMNLLNSQVQPEEHSTGTESRNVFTHVQSSDGHQPDGLLSNPQSESLIANGADVANEPALVFRSQHLPYGRPEEQHISNHQPSDAQGMPRGYVLLPHGPPGREGTRKTFHPAQ